ncbi:MAG: hypothetical protein R3C44_14450 [Chloroflexota bacterium]
MDQLAGQIGGKEIGQATMGQGYGNLEYTWGWALARSGLHGNMSGQDDNTRRPEWVPAEGDEGFATRVLSGLSGRTGWSR